MIRNYSLWIEYAQVKAFFKVYFSNQNINSSFLQTYTITTYLQHHYIFSKYKKKLNQYYSIFSLSYYFDFSSKITFKNVLFQSNAYQLQQKRQNMLFYLAEKYHFWRKTFNDNVVQFFEAKSFGFYITIFTQNCDGFNFW